MDFLKCCVHRLLAWTPYEVRKRRGPGLPSATMNPVRLGLAYFARLVPPGTLVQIGACDGVEGDPVHEFVRNGSVRAVLVEPIDSNFRKLVDAYTGVRNVSLIQAAVSVEDGTATMYRAAAGTGWQAEKWIEQIASFDPQHLLKHGLRRDEIEAVQVPALSLATLLSRCGLASTDFLQIDAEGFDAEVIAMALKLPTPPKFINFEHKHLTAASIQLVYPQLQAAGYRWMHGRYDTLAIHQRAIDELSRLPGAAS